PAATCPAAARVDKGSSPPVARALSPAAGGRPRGPAGNRLPPLSHLVQGKPAAPRPSLDTAPLHTSAPRSSERPPAPRRLCAAAPQAVRFPDLPRPGTSESTAGPLAPPSPERRRGRGSSGRYRRPTVLARPAPHPARSCRSPTRAGSLARWTAPSPFRPAPAQPALPRGADGEWPRSPAHTRG